MTVRDLLAYHPEGLSRPELLRLAREQINPAIGPLQVETELRALGKQIRETDGRLVLTADALAMPTASSDGPRPAHVVVFDLESVVRQTSLPPDYAERHVYQIGARRISYDPAWRRERPRTFGAFVRLPDTADGLLDRADHRMRYEAEAQEPTDAYRAFLDFCTGADYLVAYNGTTFDFPLLDRELRGVGQAMPKVKLVDGLYLALALWPVPPNQHRLRGLLERLGLDTGSGFWHDAVSDAKALAIVLQAGTRVVRNWPPEVQALIVSAGRGSDAWEMLLGLMESPPSSELRSDSDIRQAIRAGLSGRATLRAVARPKASDGEIAVPKDEPADVPPPPPVARQLQVPARIRRGDGRVDVFRLASAAKGQAEARRAQADMVEAMTEWVRDKRTALVEAPTGTGKSFAMLTVALDWLAADPNHRVVISTFTKALQQQLADDLQRLSETIPGLLDVADLVKGQANRLSLRGLTLTLGDLVEPPRRGRRSRDDFSREPRYRDLVLFLTLRLFARGTETENWLARSVDTVDVPAFFEDYTYRRCSLYLLHLSQAKAGDFEDDAGEAIAAYTASAREAIASKRLIIANHALLFANLDAFEAIGEQTLLMVDEAHALEDAATTTLSAAVDTPAIEQLAVDTAGWLAERAEEPSAVRAALSALEQFLDDETLPRAAMRAFDLVVRDRLAGDYPRSMTVASPVEGTRREGDLLGLRVALRSLAEKIRSVERSFSTVSQVEDPIERDRFFALRTRFRELSEQITRIVADLRAIDEPGGDQTNRIVWATELQPLGAREPRRYRFRALSSPLELGPEPLYRAFTERFPRAYYISATLRVAGSFDFMRRRLALSPSHVEAITLPTPFSYAEQARLVVFDDFPSWSEQTEAAVRSVAHQVTSYARAAIRGAENGVMVLTTSKSAVAGIVDRIVRNRARDGGEYAVSSAELLGTRRAVDNFKALGGVLVGTKGLWQGTDVDAAERLRIVWVNKLPFAPFDDPLIRTRKALIARDAETEGEEDPDTIATLAYYLPLAAIQLRQAVGRLIRTRDHRGVIIISDRRLAGPTRLRRLYREVFLGSLDQELLVNDPETGERAGGNVRSMADGWRLIWDFLAGARVIDATQHALLTSETGLAEQTLLPELRTIREQEMTPEQEAAARAQGSEAFAEELLRRANIVAGALKGLGEGEGMLRTEQAEALRHLCADRDLLAVLPTGYGKSYIFQLPALILSGVTVVISPLVSLMTDQALELNRTIGGQVRALVAPMRESNSRTGKAEVMEELTSAADRHHIKIVYLSPERLCQRNFQDWIRTGVKVGKLRRIAIDEAHTFVTWGDDFRPSFRRAEQFLQRLRRDHPELRMMALTATATRTVRDGLQRAIFGIGEGEPNPPTFALVQANPIRPELALYKRTLGPNEGGPLGTAGLVDAVVDKLDAHTIVYCLTVKEAIATYNRLDTHLGQADRDRLYLYHGRLPETMKNSVLNDFKSAPRAGEDGFRPMIIVATSAFGLGVDRPDIRCVFVLSPPTDIAALYQQVGRAGRDHQTAFGLMLATGRAYRTIRFMTRGNLDPDLVERITERLLVATPPIATELIATELVSEDLQATPPRLTQDQVEHGARDQYRIYVVRVLAELAAAGLLHDGGDFPEAVRLVHGLYEPDTPEMVAFVKAIWEAVADQDRVPIMELYAALKGRFEDEFEEPGGLFTALLRLHALGYLEVSQAVEGPRLLLTQIEHTGALPPTRWVDRFERRRRAIESEVVALQDFFDDTGCLNRAFARYFEETDLPDGVCGGNMEGRCSFCRSRADVTGEDPPLFTAFSTYRHRPAAARELRSRERERLAGWILRLLRSQRTGRLAANVIDAVLQGKEGVRKADGTWKPLWPPLTTHKATGRYVGLRRGELRHVLEALEERGELWRDGGLWVHSAFTPRPQQAPALAEAVVIGHGRRP